MYRTVLDSKRKKLPTFTNKIFILLLKIFREKILQLKRRPKNCSEKEKTIIRKKREKKNIESNYYYGVKASSCLPLMTYPKA